MPLTAFAWKYWCPGNPDERTVKEAEDALAQLAMRLKLFEIACRKKHTFKNYRLKPVDSFATESRGAAEAA